MQIVSQEFKNTIKQNTVFSDGYLEFNDGGEYTETFTSDDISFFEIQTSAFNNGKVVGNIAQGALTIELLGDKTSNIPLNRKIFITPYIGVFINSTQTYEYVKYNSFLITEVLFDRDTNVTNITATDYLVRLNIDYKDNVFNFPVTLRSYVSSVLSFCGLTLHSNSFFNENFQVSSLPFNDFTSAREIISKAAELALCFVVIDRDNGSVKFENAFKKPQLPFDLVMDKDEYFKIKLKDDIFGSNGINTLVLRLSQIEGENNTKVNQSNVNVDGNIEVVIEDNDFINSETLRLLVLDNMFSQVTTFKYNPLEVEYRGFPYLELNDKVRITSDTKNYYFNIYDFKIKYDGGLHGNLIAEGVSQVQTSNKFVSKVDKRIRNTEIKVDKVEGEITAVVSNVDGLETRLTLNEQGLETKVSAAYVDNKIAEINQATPNRVSNLPDNYAQGDITLGVNADSDYHIRTRAFYPIRTGFVTVQIVEPYQVKLVLYDSSFNYVDETAYGDLYTFSLSGATFFKAVVKRTQVQLITEAEIETSQFKVANESSATAWNLYYGDYTLEAQRDLYQFFIQSVEGLTFDENTVSLTLNAVVLLNGVDTTELQLDNQFAWSRKSKDSAKDTAFNNLGLTGKELVLSSTYLDRSATYICTFSIPDTAYLLTFTGDRLLTFDGDYLVALVSEVI